MQDLVQTRAINGESSGGLAQCHDQQAVVDLTSQPPAPPSIPKILPPSPRSQHDKRSAEAVNGLMQPSKLRQRDIHANSNAMLASKRSYQSAPNARSELPLSSLDKTDAPIVSQRTVSDAKLLLEAAAHMSATAIKSPSYVMKRTLASSTGDLNGLSLLERASKSAQPQCLKEPMIKTADGRSYPKRYVFLVFSSRVG